MSEINWSLGLNSGPSLADAFNVGQQQAVQAQQTRLQLQAAAARQQRQTALAGQVQTRLQSGDTLGAAALQAQYDPEGAAVVRQAGTDQNTQSRASNTAFANIAGALAQIPSDGGPEIARRAAIQQARPYLLRIGFHPDEIDSFVPTNDNLTALSRLDYTHKDEEADTVAHQNADNGTQNAGSERMNAETNRDNSNRQVVGPESALVTRDPTTGAWTPVYRAPHYESVDPTHNFYETDPGVSSAPSAPGAPASVTPQQQATMGVLYDQFIARGMTPQGARTMVAQIGRENGYDPSLMFGSHTDSNNGATNGGIVSWQGARRPAFVAYMQAHGFVQNGQIVQSEAALRAQADFADQEMRRNYPQSAAAVRDPNATYQSIEPVLSNNYFGWDRAGHHIDAQAHLQRMGGYYAAMGGSAPQQESQGGNGAPAQQTAAGGNTGRSSGPRLIQRGQDPNAETSLSGDALTMQADSYIMTGQMPSLGQGRAAAANRVAIINRAAEIAGVRGMDGGAMAGGFARYRANRAALQGQETQLANIRSAEGTALSNADTLLTAQRALPAQTRLPLVNSFTQFAQRQGGGTAVGAYDLAYQTFITEYARVISTGSSGNGQITDTARAEAMHMVPYNASPAQMASAVRQARIDMHNRVQAYERTIRQGYANLSGGQSFNGANAPQGGPPGRQVGTYQGRPVYELADGRRVVGH